MAIASLQRDAAGDFRALESGASSTSAAVKIAPDNAEMILFLFKNAAQRSVNFGVCWCTSISGILG